ncbi:two-component system sensor histidine kinase NtrB [Sphaerochaeta globosa]|uniref:histidine kinase n=1 Tax=Sphaerochaeta globosa (strain ATCC BAA-1886 / DSM 22777 / Buddy) TaxID=158189 RepID=F0RYX0_SPHGB|nr:ATP-binding protein [Sphaerochaeta globosa]ADY13106.1 PAS/PAC sensor signal transduction histidine kinase [Sphaerochaeta globosa str. Buddy]
MKNFVQRAIQKIDQLDSKQIVDIMRSQAGDVEMLENVLESIHDGVILTDEKLTVLYANSNCRTLVPMARFRSYEGFALSKVLDDEHVLRYINLSVQQKAADENNEFTFQKGDTLQTIAVTVFSYKSNNERIRSSYVVMFSDVTEHNANEARLRRSENLASMTTMAAGVAHEIKNPLAAMAIHLQLLRKAFGRKESLTLDDAQRYLDVLDEEISRLNSIVVDFLFAVRPMDTRLRLAQITRTLEEVTNFVMPELSEHHVRMKLDLPTSLPKLEFDEHLIKQALLNLIKNAMNAMEGGGMIILQVRHDQNQVLLKVIDTGIGMDEQTQQKIFEPYFTTKATGTGLGLTVVYKIMKEHKGDITVQSKLGEGTTFTLYFPVPKSERLALDSQAMTEANYEA